MKNNILSELKTYLPRYETILPVSKQKAIFVAFKVKDAKNLSIIFQENNKKLAVRALYDLLKNNSENIDVDSLCLADAEYLFLQIRSKSIDEIITVLFENKRYELNIDSIKTINSLSKSVIELNESVKIELESPTLSDFLSMSSLEPDDLKKAHINRIIVKNEIFEVKKFCPDELKTLLENLPLNVLTKIEKFIQSQPRLYSTINLEDGSEKEVGGTLDFFIFR